MTAPLQLICSLPASYMKFFLSFWQLLQHEKKAPHKSLKFARAPKYVCYCFHIVVVMVNAGRGARTVASCQGLPTSLGEFRMN